ncbi:MAG: hypothetical protein NC200_06055 [Candidatus Gastranaerophilales bacterium]|nr:hypothetical protein [Candidatus Gastranaerophilales bacterium]
MIFLIATVFIAQIVILVNIVLWAISLDKKVRVLSAKIEQDNTKLEKRINAIKEISEGIKIILPHLIKKIVKKRNNIIFKILIELLQGSVLVFFKPKYKKLLLGIKLGLAVAKDLSKR